METSICGGDSRGTTCCVGAGDDAGVPWTEFCVHDGTVAVYRHDGVGGEVLVSAGKRSRIVGADAPTAPDDIPADHVCFTIAELDGASRSGGTSSRIANILDALCASVQFETSVLRPDSS